ncbi:TIGR02117 family protein [Aliirhizobium terrae]|uniref:TIGR02117 family protein n=1 Tax=Terrirhizobium terrae TaxID=2926709 RepID=UPI00257730B8|nr:TIGR02117 family protein [Rhizobium sp. CC-CFT758]WJH40622.1 TIGR02117 family protein [Rhizobium sp. CC-CFT758]
MKSAFRVLLAVVAVIVLAVAAGTFVPRPLSERGSSGEAAETRRILVLSNPIHTDIAIPLDAETRAAYGFLGAFGVPVGEPGAEWLIIGWGGRAFYLETPTWAELKPMPLFRALTIDRSVMHVDVAGGIEEEHPSIRSFDLGPAEFGALSDFIQASFVRNGGNVVVIPDASYGMYDRFFEAHGSFNALVGCNTWTARALRSAGIRTGWWNPLPQTLGLSLDLFN